MASSPQRKKAKFSSEDRKIQQQSVDSSSGSRKIQQQSIDSSSGSRKIQQQSVDSSSGSRKIQQQSVDSSSGSRKIQQQSVDSSSGSVFTSDGQRRSARVSVMKCTKINICNDVWSNVFDWSTRPELGLKLAPLCRRFDGLADGQFRSTRRQWTLKHIAFRRVRKNSTGSTLFKDFQCSGILLEKSALLDVLPPSNLVGFNQIRINHVDQSVIAFLHRICPRFNNVDITLKLPSLKTKQSRKFVCTLWPLIAQSVYRLTNFGQLRTLFSASILRDCANLRVIHGGFPETPADDRADASDGQALNMWLHTPRNDGLPKLVECASKDTTDLTPGLAGLKMTFVSAELPVSYIICMRSPHLVHQEPFALENQRTRERMTLQHLSKPGEPIWYWLKRGPTIWWDENKCAEIERKASCWSEKNIIFCYETMTFGHNFV